MNGEITMMNGEIPIINGKITSMIGEITTMNGELTIANEDTISIEHLLKFHHKSVSVRYFKTMESD